MENFILIEENGDVLDACEAETKIEAEQKFQQRGWISGTVKWQQEITVQSPEDDENDPFNMDLEVGMTDIETGFM